MLAVFLCTGCGRARPEEAVVQKPIHFHDPEKTVRIELLGDLGSLLPRFDATPALQAFLYGPSDYGKTALGNPQAMCLVGDRLLVGDQSYPGIVAIDLSTGRSLLWERGQVRSRCPVALACDGASRVFVADTTLRSVLIYDESGRPRGTLRPEAASAPQFRPAGLVWNDGVLYIGNIGDHRVERYALLAASPPPADVEDTPTSSGGWLAPIIGSEGARMVAPCGLAISPDRELLVADAVLGTLDCYGLDGNHRRRIARSGRTTEGLIRPKQIALLDNLVFVADAGRQSVQVYRLDGRWVTEIQEQPGLWEGWTLPSGLLACPPVSPQNRPYTINTDRPGRFPGRSATGNEREPYVPLSGNCLLVADTLGVPSITVLRVHHLTASPPEANHAP